MGIVFGWLLAVLNNFASIRVQNITDVWRQWTFQSIRFGLLAVLLFGGLFFLNKEAFVFVLSYFATHFILLVRDLIRIHRLNYA